MSGAPRIGPGTRVELAYRLLGADGAVVESSDEAGPMRFAFGADEVFPALEEALLGLAPGDERTVVLEPEDAFGEVDLEAVFSVPRDSLPEGPDPVVGDVVPILLEPDDEEVALGAEPEEVEAVVREVSEDGVVLDANHPLAGHRLTFEVRVLLVES